MSTEEVESKLHEENAKMFAKLQQRVAGVENNSSSSVWG